MSSETNGDAAFWSEVRRCAEDGETVVVACGRTSREPEALPGGTEEGLRQTIGLRAAFLGELRAELVKRRNRSRAPGQAEVIDEVLAMIDGMAAPKATGNDELRDAVRYAIVRRMNCPEFGHLFRAAQDRGCSFDALIEDQAPKFLGRTFEAEVSRRNSLDVAEATFAGGESADRHLRWEDREG